MEYNITKLQNEKGLDIDIIKITNSNNYSFSFYTFGGYMSEVCIPSSSNPSEVEDVLLLINTLKEKQLLSVDGVDMRFGSCATLNSPRHLEASVTYLKQHMETLSPQLESNHPTLREVS